SGHKITIHGADDELTETDGYGGHMMVMNTESRARIQGVELYKMGQSHLLGRYPMHWHNVNDGGVNSFMRNCAVRDCLSRGVTIHKTNGVKVSDVVAHGTIGHCYFFEDGRERGNWLDHCIGGQIYRYS